jgi:hypothetical protein
MKEAYAVRRTVPPSAEIQAEIDKLLGKGMVDDPQKMLSELGRAVAGGPPGDEGLWDVRSACCTGASGRSAWAVHRRAAAKADPDFDFRVRPSRRRG